MNQTIFETPICIIGAGPAGAVASMVLSNAGVPHFLIDRSVFPRDKICGETFDGRVFHVLRRVNEPLLQRMLADGILTKTSDYYLQPFTSKWSYFNTTLSPSKPRPTARRIVFDNTLFQTAQSSAFCTAWEGVKVANIRTEADGTHIEMKDGRTIHTQLTILACGANSPLLAYFNLIANNKNLLLVARGGYHNLGLMPNKYATELYAVEKPVKGFISITNHRDNLSNIELFIPEHIYKNQNQHIFEVFEDTLNTFHATSGRFTEANKQNGSKIMGTSIFLKTKKKRYVGKRVMLAGASAYCLNPVTGMGVGNAMKMGELAGYQAIACYQKGDYSELCLNEYGKKIEHLYRSTYFMNFMANMISYFHAMS
jgi:menaquinone-9 beta-reductase